MTTTTRRLPPPTQQMLEILDRIYIEPGIGSARLARMTGLSTNAITGSAAALKKRDWVENTRVKKGQTSEMSWTATPTGRAALKQHAHQLKHRATAAPPQPPATVDRREAPITNGSVKGDYMGEELRPFTARPGANDHMQCGHLVAGRWAPYTPPTMSAAGVGGRA